MLVKSDRYWIIWPGWHQLACSCLVLKRRLWLVSRHFPDNPQIQENRTTVPPPRELLPFGSHPMTRFWRSARAWKAIRSFFSPSRHTSLVAFTWPSIPPAYARAGLGRRSSIRLRIFRNNSLGTATSANWNVTYRPWRTTLAPILTSFSRSVVRDQCSTSFGKASVRMKLARLYASA